MADLVVCLQLGSLFDGMGRPIHRRKLLRPLCYVVQKKSQHECGVMTAFMDKWTYFAKESMER